jgi:superfamily II DNA or RNA helicase
MNDDLTNKNVYPNLKVNGRIFPIWLLKNFKKYKLPEIIRKDNEDPCGIKTKLELKKYQEFIASYLDYNSPYHDILLYYGVGAGKSASILAIYNALYNATAGWNVFLLIKASLHDNPWEAEIKKWLQKDDYSSRYGKIKWIHYDSPYADREFFDEIRKTDTSLKNMYIIDEAHNFIRNVYSNITSQKGKRAVNIYDHIVQDKKENQSTRIVLLSATPAINRPFELGLLFNLLRPDIFPKTEILFNQYFVSTGDIQTLNPITKNMFQRRIMGLVSYYIGATPDLYASQTTHLVDAKMSPYQTEIYNFFEETERNIMKYKLKMNKSSESYKTYTRQSSNFVFPNISQEITGESRPRPSKFKISDKELELLYKTKDIKNIKKTLSTQNQMYFATLDRWKEQFDLYLEEIYTKEKKGSKNVKNDIETFKKYDDYEQWVEKEDNKSDLIKVMMNCSTKFTNIIFNLFKSKGPVLIYSNYVLIEGIDILKIYLKYFGFSSFTDPNAKDYFKYGEFHNDISREERKKAIQIEQHVDNKYGKNIKIMLFSPAGAEGISLNNIRQIHITEPYWHEVRIVQMIGRGVRQCSHKDLPQEERHVDIYRYKSVKDNVKIVETRDGQLIKKEKVVLTDPELLKTVDFEIEEMARTKNNLIQTFLDAIKEVAIDCVLNKEHNKLGSQYKCFQFNEVSMFDKNISPAYKENIIDDMKFDNGSNSTKTVTVRIKAVKIVGIIDGLDDKEGNNIENYWYNSESRVVYDYDLHFQIGKVKVDEEGIPIKINKDVYVIDAISIPILSEKRRS